MEPGNDRAAPFRQAFGQGSARRLRLRAGSCGGQSFLVAATDRPHAAWLLALDGLRRGEVLGLRWDAFDCDRRSIAITQARVSVGGVVHVSDPKTARGRRVLPLTDEVAQALQDLRERQVAERRAADVAYQDSGCVVVDEIGGVRPLSPRRLRGLRATHSWW